MSEDKLTKEQKELRSKYSITYEGIAYKNLEAYLEDNYTNKSVTSMAKELGMNRATIQNKAKKLGLHKFEPFTELLKGEEKVPLEYPWENYFFTNKGRLVSEISNIVMKTHYKQGYLRYKIHRDGKWFSISQHRLLALNFIRNTDPENKIEVNHINGIRDDNRIENLEWVTSAENNIHAIRVLKRKGMYGEGSPLAKITEEQAIEIITQLNEGKSSAEIVREYSFATKGIIDGIKSYSWGHLDHLKNWK